MNAKLWSLQDISCIGNNKNPSITDKIYLSLDVRYCGVPLYFVAFLCISLLSIWNFHLPFSPLQEILLSHLFLHLLCDGLLQFGSFLFLLHSGMQNHICKVMFTPLLPSSGFKPSISYGIMYIAQPVPLKFLSPKNLYTPHHIASIWPSITQLLISSLLSTEKK